MLDEFLKPGPQKSGAWFRVKKYGYGAGLPINWQGWAFIGALVGVLSGIGLLAENKAGWAQALSMAAFILTATYGIIIAARRTDGEWRWRWGEEDTPPPPKKGAPKRRSSKERRADR